VATSPTDAFPSYNASLSQREVALLASWERERRVYITIDELGTAVGSARAKDVANALLGKGVLQRIRRGLYLVRPLRSLLRPTMPSPPLMLGAFLHTEPYYLGGRWAFTFPY
jgi:hypothetical protein